MGFIFIRDKGFNEAWIAHGEVDMSWAGSPAAHGFRTWHFQAENCGLLGMHAVASAGAVRNCATQVGRVGPRIGGITVSPQNSQVFGHGWDSLMFLDRSGVNGWIWG